MFKPGSTYAAEYGGGMGTNPFGMIVHKTKLPVVGKDNSKCLEVLWKLKGLYYVLFFGGVRCAYTSYKVLLLDRTSNVALPDLQSEYHCTMMFLSHSSSKLKWFIRFPCFILATTI